MSGVLVLSILLSTPTGMKAAEAAGQKRTDRERTAVVQTDAQPDCRGGEEKATETEVLSEESLEDPTEVISEQSSEDPSEVASEITSEIASEPVSEITSEIASEPVSEADSELIHEEITELENNTEEEWLEIPVSYFSPEISDDGELDYRTYVDEGADRLIRVKKSEVEQTISKGIKVKNSPLCDSDFYIELSGEGQIQRYEYPEWIKYLESCHGWVNDKVEIKLSDAGKKYFDSIQIEEQESESGKGKKNYIFWAVNSGKNASTKDVENGTRIYTAGRDLEAPVLKDFSADNECYGPTRTDAEQYFAEDFVLKGVFGDDVSGVSRIEYTTDIRSGENAVWIEAENAQHTEAQEPADSAVGFEIVLSDGCYPAIAIRAYDEAGNVSDIKKVVNETGESIKIVVDSTAPVLRFDVSAGGQPYDGRNDNWTNKDVRIEVMADNASCAYAGIYQYEYVYRKVGENMTDVSENWTELSVQNSAATLEITEDKNGYYLFRAVSKSGVATAEDAEQRVLIQHQASEMKPVLVSGADETKRKNGWYNKQSGTPEIRFAYPDYDTGVISKEYDAPITLCYELTKRDTVSDTLESEWSGETGEAPGAGDTARKAVIGVMDCKNVKTNADGSQEFVLTKDDLNQHVVDFACEDGFYTLKYWTADKAGNVSEKQVYHYKIDCNEPTDLTMELAGSAFDVGEEPMITYRKFYRDAISGSADAEYGISGKGSLVIRKVKRPGEWKGMMHDGFESTDSISIEPNTRCFLYIRAEDAAGNIAEGWTNGIVVDNMAPNESQDGNHKELIIEPGGANKHGFFNDDITIDICIKDAPEDDNCAALKSVTSSIGRDGTDTIAGQELFSFTKDAPTEEEIIAASGFQGTQIIDAKANESNEAYIEVTATDRSDNRKTSTQLLKIDVTRPEIEITFDNSDAVNGNYYRQGRTVTIHVHELNFDPDAVFVSVAKDGEAMEITLSDWRSDNCEHYATFALTEDGEYSITASCVDLADNASDEVQSETFVIDHTAPAMTIALTAGQEVQAADRAYFNTGVTAVVTVTERNFRPEDFRINMTPVSEKGVWSHEGDVHTLRIPVEGDNRYHMECACTDMAGNSADTVEKEFTIDTMAPVIRIDGVADGSANSGAILPVISVSDSNIELSDIVVSVRTGIGDIVTNAIETALIAGEGGTEYRLTLTDMTEKADNIYDLTVSVCDQAGNVTERTHRFSLNRNGSVYDLSSLAHLMKRQYNTYGALQDIRIVEMNIDTVEEFALYVSRNGAIGYEARYTREMYGSADTGYTYVYRIGKENFAAEGIYRLTLYSRDRAGNEVNNAADIRGEEIAFTVDNTPPRVVIDGVEPGKVYDVEAQEVHVIVTDNFKLAEAEFTLVNKANEVLERWDYMELVEEAESLKIVIPQHSETVSLLYRVKDAAGNEMQTFQGERASLADFLVTTDRYVQLINKPAQTFTGSLIILIASPACVLAAIAWIKRKHRKGLLLLFRRPPK